jgi:hypothetical protein
LPHLSSSVCVCRPRPDSSCQVSPRHTEIAKLGTLARQDCLPTGFARTMGKIIPLTPAIGSDRFMPVRSAERRELCPARLAIVVARHVNGDDVEAIARLGRGLESGSQCFNAITKQDRAVLKRKAPPLSQSAR